MTSHDADPSDMVPGHAPAGIHGVLSVLEEMAAEAGAGGATTSEVPEHFAWLPLSAAGDLGRETAAQPPRTSASAALVERFQAVDEIRPRSNSLRVGFCFLAGTVTRQGRTRRLFEPLVVMRVQVGDGWIERIGDVELTELVTDRHLRLQLEQEVSWGGAVDGVPATVGSDVVRRLERVTAHARRVAHAAGHVVEEVVGADGRRPSTLRDREGLRIVVGLALYATGARPEFSPAAGLALWHAHVSTNWTALHSLYLDATPPQAPAGPDLPSAYELSHAQHRAVIGSRAAPVSVIAGAPGTGKTHTIAAIVGDAIARGQSVLVAAKSDPALEAITELLERRPGPDPVIFGSSGRRWSLARRLAAGDPTPVPRREIQRRAAGMEAARLVRDQRWADAAAVLEGLELLGEGAQALGLRRRLPVLSRPGADLVGLGRLVAEAGTQPPAWWRFGRRRAWRGLLQALGLSGAPAPADLAALQRLGEAVTRLHGLTDRLGCGVDWDALVAANHALALRTGEWMDAVARDEGRLDRHARGTLGALAGALRAGRATRRTRLASLAGQGMTEALPVWVGTLGDIDDLLPFQPAMFDLVVLDEASSMDQPRAAAALLRGGRAVVVGDPQQLRHVSFVATDAVESALDTHLPGASPGLRAKLDVRGNSAFDVAAAGWPVLTLAEHFRSVPHLFSFVGRRLYRDEVALATRTPVTDRQDRIGVVRLDGARNARKVVQAEVDWVVARLRALHEGGHRSVGVISPFRAQADALEDAALMQLGRRTIQALSLRVGTVHAFQGMERDLILASLGIGPDDGPGTWRFANDPNLFAVFATRARQAVEVVHSADPPTGSLLAEYLAQVDHPPMPPSGLPAGTDSWTRSVAEAIVDAGVTVTGPYPAGQHAVDLCLYDGEAYLGAFTRLHPDGPHAHVRREVELRAAGWPLRLALPQLWEGQRAELAVALVEALRRT